MSWGTHELNSLSLFSLFITLNPIMPLIFKAELPTEANRTLLGNRWYHMALSIPLLGCRDGLNMLKRVKTSAGRLQIDKKKSPFNQWFPPVKGEVGFLLPLQGEHCSGKEKLKSHPHGPDTAAPLSPRHNLLKKEWDLLTH